MPQPTTILVTGGTGRQGGAAARNLLRIGQSVRVMTRNPENGRDLEKVGAQIVRGDFDDYGSLEEAVRDVRGVFLMGTPYEKGPGTEEEQGKAMVYACSEEGVQHIVYSSISCADRGTGIPHFESKHGIEEYLRNSGLPYTILRPVSFMENFASPWMLNSLENGVLSLPLDPDTNLQMVCVDDIGRIASAAFMSPQKFSGTEIDIAGDERKIRDAVQDISCAMNRPIRYERISDESAEDLLGYDLAVMYRWFNEDGFDADIPELRKRYEVPMTSFSRFLGKSGLYRKAA